MSTPVESALVSDAKELAAGAVRFVTGQVGQRLVVAVLEILVGASGQEIIHDLTAFVAVVLQGARELLTDEELRAEIAAANAAVDKSADVLEEARLAALAGKLPAT